MAVDGGAFTFAGNGTSGVRNTGTSNLPRSSLRERGNTRQRSFTASKAHDATYSARHSPIKRESAKLAAWESSAVHGFNQRTSSCKAMLDELAAAKGTSAWRPASQTGPRRSASQRVALQLSDGGADGNGVDYGRAEEGATRRQAGSRPEGTDPFVKPVAEETSRRIKWSASVQSAANQVADAKGMPRSGSATSPELESALRRSLHLCSRSPRKSLSGRSVSPSPASRQASVPSSQRRTSSAQPWRPSSSAPRRAGPSNRSVSSRARDPASPRRATMPVPVAEPEPHAPTPSSGSTTPVAGQNDHPSAALLADTLKGLRVLAQLASRAGTQCHASAPLAKALYERSLREFEGLAAAQADTPAADRALGQRVFELQAATAKAIELLRDALEFEVSLGTEANVCADAGHSVPDTSRRDEPFDTSHTAAWESCTPTAARHPQESQAAERGRNQPMCRSFEQGGLDRAATIHRHYSPRSLPTYAMPPAGPSTALGSMWSMAERSAVNPECLSTPSSVGRFMSPRMSILGSTDGRFPPYPAHCDWATRMTHAEPQHRRSAELAAALGGVVSEVRQALSRARDSQQESRCRGVT